MKKSKRIVITFLIILYGVLLSIGIMTGLEVVHIIPKNPDNTWKVYSDSDDIFTKIEVNIENRVTNYFPLYNKVTELFKKVNEKANSLFGSRVPVGKNNDGDYIVKDTKNSSYYKFSSYTYEEMKSREEMTSKYYNELYKSNNVPLYIYLPVNFEFISGINKDYVYEDFSPLIDEFKSNLDSNIKVSSLSVDKYNNYFYKSDHHWNMHGALKGYQDIMNMLGEEAQNIEVIDTDYKFNGSFSKAVRDYSVYDYFSYPKGYNTNYTVTVNGKEPHKNYKPLRFDILNKNKRDFYDFYVGYFNGGYGEVVYDFNNPSKDNLLIIGDSYSWCVDFLIANSFNKTYVLNLKSDYYENHDLDYKKFIEDNNIDKVLILEEVNTSVFDTYNHNYVEKVVR